MACTFFTIFSGKLDIFMVLHGTRTWDKVEAIWSDYSKRKRWILLVHHMKLHDKLNASGFLLEIDTFLNE